ncbi:MAG TPA: ABC transporter permease [Burkholderiales bacterium]|nr:ABC transporter permease [Burkholderiales bacterium]
MRTLDSVWGVRCVWLRYFDVFRKSLTYYLVTTFSEPVLYLLAFGLGVGSLIGALKVNGTVLSYRSFVFAGILGQTVLFQGFYEASYGGFVRMYYQKIFTAMAVTPITLSEVLWGELLWDATKSTVAAEVVVLIGVATRDFPPVALLAVLPVAFVSSLLFAGMGLTVAARSRSIDEISYPQYLLVFPMFLFCGVFYPIEQLPAVLQWFAWVLPLTSVNSLMRTLTLGLPFQVQSVPILAAWLLVLVAYARRSMYGRLVK